MHKKRVWYIFFGMHKRYFTPPDQTPDRIMFLNFFATETVPVHPFFVKKITYHPRVLVFFYKTNRVLLFQFFQKNHHTMYAVRFHSSDSSTLQTTSQAIECKRFENRLFSSPSDRHIYTSKFYANPIR